MRVVLDEGIPKQVTLALRGHEVTTVPDAGWASKKNGALLDLVEGSGFRALVTCDKNLEYQQHQLERRPFAILILSTNHWPSMQPYFQRIVEAIERCEPGTVSRIECGSFVPRKFR